MDENKISNTALGIFQQSVADYHKHDNINQPIKNPYAIALKFSGIKRCRGVSPIVRRTPSFFMPLFCN